MTPEELAQLKNGIMRAIFSPETCNPERCVVSEDIDNAMSTVDFCNNTSVGIIVKRFDDILLIERKKSPVGFACPAGHVEYGELFDVAALRELREETELDDIPLQLVAEGERFNHCRRENGTYHYWKVYQGCLDAAPLPITPCLNRDECKSIGFYTPSALALLARRTELYQAQLISEDAWQQYPGLEPVWYYWLRGLRLIRGTQEE